MRRERSFKITAIIILAFAVVGVSIGFAAYARDLTINIGGTITPEDTFTLQFSDASGAQTVGDVSVGNSKVGATAVISGDGSTISTITAKFQKPGDSAVLTFYVTNTSIYDAYLKSITYSKTAASCTGAGVPEATRNAVCASMSMEISVGTSTGSYATTSVDSTSVGDVPNNLIAAKNGSTLSSKAVTLTLTYGGSTAVDSSITVDFGSITLGYSTSNS